MKYLVPVTALLLAVFAASASAGEVKVQLANGRITVQAKDAYVRDILAEWARVGGVKIVNGEKVAGAPVTLELQSVPEGQALATLLRSVSGYVASPRTQGPATGSMYATVLIMSAPRSLTTVSAGAMPQQQPPPQQFYRGMQGPVMLDDQDQPVGPAPTYPQYGPGGYPQGYPPNQQMRGMLQQQQQQQQPGSVSPSPMPGQLPTGAAGTISPVPQQPGAAGQPGTAAQPGVPGTGPAGTVSQPPKKPGGPGGPGGSGEDGGSGEGGR